MSTLGYIFRHPFEAAKAVIHGYRHSDDYTSTAEDEEKKLEALKLAVFFYKHQFGRFPEKLEDLCFNNHSDPSWSGAFIKWQGKSTFVDLFGYPYRYHVADDEYHLSSPGLDNWNQKKKIEPSGSSKPLPPTAPEAG